MIKFIYRLYKPRNSVSMNSQPLPVQTNNHLDAINKEIVRSQNKILYMKKVLNQSF